MAPSSSDRGYEGRPLLKLVECFVLKAIGHLEPGTEATLQRMTPKLQQIYSKTGSWDDVIKDILAWPADIEAQIRTAWEAERMSCSEAGHDLSAAEFTVSYVDRLFSDSRANDA